MDVPEDDLRIARRVRAARLSRDLTLSQVSERSGVSAAHLSRLENAARRPTVRVLMQIAQAMGMSLSDLVGESAPNSDVYVSRASDRNAVVGGKKEPVALSDPRSRILQAFELHLEPGRVGEPTRHMGEELIYVVSGSLDVLISATATILGPGDAIHFSASLPHCLRNPSSASATALIITSIGTLSDPSLH